MDQVHPLSACALAAALLLLGCPEPDPEPLEPTPNLGADPSIRALPGQSRAGVIREGSGPEAYIDGIGAEARPGDIKIWNTRVQFVIQGAYRSHGWIDVGGTIIDADLVRPEGDAGYDMVDDIFLSFGAARLFEADTVEIVTDGSVGGPAIVRAHGRDVLWDFFDGALELDEPLLGDLGLAITTEYFLPPESSSMRVTTTFRNAGDVEASFVPSDGWMISGEDTDSVWGGHGIADEPPGSFDWAGWVGRRAEGAFGAWVPGATMESPSVASLLTIASLSMVGDGTRRVLAPGDEERWVRWFALAEDTAGLDAERRLRDGAPQIAVGGTVTDDGGAPVEGARVHLVAASGTVHGFARTGAEGGWSASLPPGDYTAYAVGRGPHERVLPRFAGRYPPLGTQPQQAAQVDRLRLEAPPLPFAEGYGAAVAPFALVDDPVTVDLEPAAPGFLQVSARDDSARGLPVVLDVIRTDGDARPAGIPEPLLSPFGLPTSSTHAARVWTLRRTPFALPPGTYTVRGAHGHRHERAEGEVTIEPGLVTPLDLTFDEVVEREGWYSVDPHLHAAPSMDGSLAMEERIAVCAVAGVEVPVTTDHDRMVDYGPVVAGLGLRGALFAVPGVEVTPIQKGHFNLFPVEPDRDAVNHGALRWWDRYPDADALHAAGRATAPEGAILQVNHGRNPLGMFDLAGWTADRVSRPERFSLDFELMEIVTTKDEDDWARNRNDWMALLNQGERKVPTGASDSHDRSHACGAGRTDVMLDNVAIVEGDADAVRDALLSGAVVVAAGPTLRATLNGAPPGSTVSGGSAELAIEVRSPSWIRPDVVRIWKDGAVLEEFAVGEADAGLWFERTVEVSADADAWFAVEVDGATPLGHLWGGATPYALTNAFFLDVP